LREIRSPLFGGGHFPVEAILGDTCESERDNCESSVSSGVAGTWFTFMENWIFEIACPVPDSGLIMGEFSHYHPKIRSWEKSDSHASQTLRDRVPFSLYEPMVRPLESIGA
jgi:hypothetical protein